MRKLSHWREKSGYIVKASGKQPALSASKPGTGKQRAGDTFEIDLLSGVITTVTPPQPHRSGGTSVTTAVKRNSR